jgi:hypothetical protein
MNIVTPSAYTSKKAKWMLAIFASRTVSSMVKTLHFSSKLFLMLS